MLEFKTLFNGVESMDVLFLKKYIKKINSSFLSNAYRNNTSIESKNLKYVISKMELFLKRNEKFKYKKEMKEVINFLKKQEEKDREIIFVPF